MNKIQQFNIFSFDYDRLESSNFDINTNGLGASDGREIIALADSELLRAVRRITCHEFSDVALRELKTKKKRLVNCANSEFAKKSILEINEKIRELLFIKEIVSITFDSRKHYNKLNASELIIDGEKYIWLMCGAGHQRTNRSIYVAEKIYTKLDNVLVCGAEMVDMVPAKYNAYYALSSSSTYAVCFPKVCVVDDLEIEMTKLVDFADGENVTRQHKKMIFNLFDGQGLVSPDFAKQWASDMGIYDYIPSAFGIRCAFIKGMCVTFDFHKFAKNISGKDVIKDLWGNNVDINTIDVILTKSQFKLWNCYKSWENYEKNVEKVGFSWGISKVSPKICKEKASLCVNYQFLQALTIDDCDIDGLCKQTVDWISGVLGEDINLTELYFLGKIANEEDCAVAFSKIQDYALKCLVSDNSLINDSYFKNRVAKSINKKIKESYFGNLIVDGNFMARISDPYALCEHIFGMEVRGLLKENEHYSYYWNRFGVSDVVAMRSPLTYRTEAHKLNLINDCVKNEWYEYITSGVIYNVFGVDCLLEAGADYDFDIVATTDNKYFLCGIDGSDIPVVYDAKKPQKEKLTYSTLVKSAGMGFDPQIGYLTNLNTTIKEMQSKYSVGTKEWNELELRSKLCCKLQSMQIDKAKGLIIDDVPRYWVDFKKAIEKDGGERGINCELLIEDRPYFMRYRYPQYNKKYNEVVLDFNRYTLIKWGKSINELSDDVKNSDEYKQMKNYYDKKIGLIDTNGVVNRICRYMENTISEIKKTNKCKNENEIFNKLFNSDIKIKEELVNRMDKIRGEYIEFKRTNNISDSKYISWEQYFNYIQDKCLSEVSSNICELANIAVYLCYNVYSKKPKDFCWDCFGEGIYENIIRGKNYIKIPLLNDCGDIKYLGKNYKQTSFEINCIKDSQNSGEIYDYNENDYDWMNEKVDIDINLENIFGVEDDNIKL